MVQSELQLETDTNANFPIQKKRLNTSFSDAESNEQLILMLTLTTEPLCLRCFDQIISTHVTDTAEALVLKLDQNIYNNITCSSDERRDLD
jgi:hypothetical protein